MSRRWVIHKKNGGLFSFVAEIPCECYLARVKDEPVAVFVFSNRFISIEEKRYSAIGFYEKCGFEINGDKQANTVPMFKFLEEEQ